MNAWKSLGWHIWIFYSQPIIKFSFFKFLRSIPASLKILNLLHEVLPRLKLKELKIVDVPDFKNADGLNNALFSDIKLLRAPKLDRIR